MADELDALKASFKPASDKTVQTFWETIAQVRAHDHPERGQDFYCLNLVAFMGEQVGPVLRRLADIEAELERLRAQLDEVKALHTDSIIGPCPSCYRPGDVSDTDDGLVWWPCPTLRALGKEPATVNLFQVLGGSGG